jgi:phage replication O-like protein O
MKFPIPNFTQIPNDFLDESIPDLKEGELRVLLVLMRQTFGWHKNWDHLSLSQFAQKTGMEKKSVARTLKNLLEKGLIKKIKQGTKGNEKCFYSIPVDGHKLDPHLHVSNEESREIEGNSNNCYQCPKDTPPSVLKTPTKETLTKQKETAASPSPSKPAAAFSIKEDLKKSNLSPEQIKEALEFYASNKKEVDSKRNPTGWLIKAIKEGWRKGDKAKQAIIEKRRQWAKANQRSSSGGYVEAGKDGVIIVSGSRSQTVKYDANSSFWDHAGLPLE